MLMPIVLMMGSKLSTCDRSLRMEANASRVPLVHTHSSIAYTQLTAVTYLSFRLHTHTMVITMMMTTTTTRTTIRIIHLVSEINKNNNEKLKQNFAS